MNVRSRSNKRPLLLLFAVAALLGCARGPCVAIVAPDGTTRASVTVEIADTNSKREVGLMYRKHMDPDSGMIFLFKSPTILKFWMHNTELPLDMIFADGNRRVVGIVGNAQPFSEKLLGPDAESQYVLEVNAGFCARQRIKAGDRLDFSGFSNRALD